MSRIPPSFSGGLVCANADVADNASIDAIRHEKTRFMEALPGIGRIGCGLYFRWLGSCRKASAAARRGTDGVLRLGVARISRKAEWSVDAGCNRRGRACPGHPRLSRLSETKSWMPGTSPA